MSDYNTLDDNGGRKPRSKKIASADVSLQRGERSRAIAGTRDLRRNASSAAWAVRKHLDHVTGFSFRPNTGDAKLNAIFAESVRTWGLAGNFEITGKHDIQTALRMLEASRLIDGDIFSYKLRNGLLQFIEGDRINDTAKKNEKRRDPKSSKQWVEGVLVNTYTGRADEFRVTNRKHNMVGNFEFSRDVPARHMYQLAYFERFDQQRGISPLLSALDMFQDNAEGFDYALAKMKIGQLFGLTFYRNADEGIGGLSGGSLSSALEGGGIAEVEDKAGYDVDMGKGAFMLDLADGDRAEIMESKTPAAEVQAFLKLTIDVALKAMDLPFSFFDESHTNFFGSRGAVLSYKKSCKSKQHSLRRFLNDWVQFKLNHSLINGLNPELTERLSEVKWEWVADGVPWWDTAKEARGSAAMIAMGLDNPQRVAEETGTDFYSNIDLIAEAQEYCKNAGVDFTLVGVSSKDLGSTDEDDNKEAGTNKVKKEK